MSRRIPECHPERVHQAFGLCAQCYLQEYHKTHRKKKDPSEYAENYRKPPHPPQRNADCHPDRPHHAKGLCGSCYVKQWENRVRATCHPERLHLADGLCRHCYAKQRYDEDPEKARERARTNQSATRKRLRDQLVEAYGGKCSCPNCPETNPAFLTLEHTNGDGKDHRAKVGSHAYADLRRRGWPKEGYTLLCWNCNSMTRGGRVCPHMVDVPTWTNA